MMTNYQSETEKQHIHEKIEELRALVETGASPTILHNLGVYHSWLDEYEDAISFYKLAEESKEIYPSATINKYRTYISWAAHLINESLDTEYPDIIQEKLKIAVDLCMKACKSTDREVLTAAHFNIGLATYLQQDPESSRNEFEQAENYCIDSQIRSLILNNKGISKSALGEYQWAIQDFESAANLYQGDDPDILNNIGVASARIAEQSNSNPDLDKAQMQFALALRLDENHGDAIHNREELANIEIAGDPPGSPKPNINDNEPNPEITKLIETLDKTTTLPLDVRWRIERAETVLAKYQDRTTSRYEKEELDEIALQYATVGEGILRLILAPWIRDKFQSHGLVTHPSYGDFRTVLLNLQSRCTASQKERFTLMDSLIKIINEISGFGAQGAIRAAAHFREDKDNTLPIPMQARALILGKYAHRSAQIGMIEIVYGLLET